MISAWARMCKILGKEFQQYLPVVMGPLMKTASIKPEVALLDSKSHNGAFKCILTAGAESLIKSVFVF